MRASAAGARKASSSRATRYPARAACGAVGRTLVQREPPYHLWEFRPGSLRRLFGACGLEVVRSRQSKIPPGRVHGRKTAVQRAAMTLIDAVNLPLTALFDVCG